VLHGGGRILGRVTAGQVVRPGAAREKRARCRHRGHGTHTDAPRALAHGGCGSERGARVRVAELHHGTRGAERDAVAVAQRRVVRHSAAVEPGAVGAPQVAQPPSRLLAQEQGVARGHALLRLPAEAERGVGVPAHGALRAGERDDQPGPLAAQDVEFGRHRRAPLVGGKDEERPSVRRAEAECIPPNVRRQAPGEPA
jgi:hypothetical protein